MFNEPGYFTALSMGPLEPHWMSLYNENSHLLASNAVFVNKITDPVTKAEIPGHLHLLTRPNILPRTPDHWYLALDHSDP